MFMKGCIFLQAVFFKNCVKGFLASVALGVGLLFLFGWICYAREDPVELMGVFAKLTLYISALAGGFVAAKLNSGKGVFSGVASGALFMLFTVILALFLQSGQSPVSPMTWVMFLSLAIAGAVGGYIANPKGKTKRRKKRNSR